MAVATKAALATALKIGTRLPVFPCNETKAPACPGGFKAAVQGDAAIRALWGRYPGPLVGVPTGPGTFDVLDLDPRHGAGNWLEANRHRLPATRTHHTRSGGLHLLFRQRPGVRNSAGRIGPGVDVRGEGGFAIWWPGAGLAVEHGRTVAEWPDWLAELAQPPQPQPWAPPPRPLVSERHAASLIERALVRVRTAPEGRRHEALRAAARTVGGLLHLLDVGAADAAHVLLVAAAACGLPQSESLSTIRWGLSSGASAPLSVGGRHG